MPISHPAVRGPAMIDAVRRFGLEYVTCEPDVEPGLQERASHSHQSHAVSGAVETLVWVRMKRMYPTTPLV